MIEVLVAVVGTLGTVIVALLQLRSQQNQKRISKKVDAINDKSSQTLDQVANTHDSNLRDDLDGKFNEVHKSIAHLTEQVTAVTDLFWKHDTRLGRMRDADHNLEDTLDRIDREGTRGLNMLFATKVPEMVRSEIAAALEHCPLHKKENTDGND